MKDTETKLTCFELRAQGKSLATIAETVGVRRQTVANWLKEHAEEVENLKAIELDALREACWMTTQARIEHLSARLEKITAELEKRDFSDVQTAKLVELELKTRAELAREFAEPRIRSEEELRETKATRTSPAMNPKLGRGGATRHCCWSPKKAVMDESGHTTLIKRRGGGANRLPHLPLSVGRG
jgi:transcriptional regulator with XRE-family HTH domain